MMNFGILKWFNSSIKKLEKALNSINHVIYTCETIQFKVGTLNIVLLSLLCEQK